MPTTTFLQPPLTLAIDGAPAKRCPDVLLEKYRQLVEEQRMSWTEHHRLMRLLGSGGQGVVYLSRAARDRQFHAAGGAEDLFAGALRGRSRRTTRRWAGWPRWRPGWRRSSRTICWTSTTSSSGTASGMMEMEWVDGYDLGRLLTHEMLERTRQRVSNRRWDISEQRDRDGRARAAAAEAGRGDGRRSASAWRRWRPCIAKGSSTATSSRRTSCSSGRATPRWSTSARPSSWTICRPSAPARPTYAAPEVLEGGESHAASRTWPAWATC